MSAMIPIRLVSTGLSFANSRAAHPAIGERAEHGARQNWVRLVVTAAVGVAAFCPEWAARLAPVRMRRRASSRMVGTALVAVHLVRGVRSAREKPPVT